MEVTSVGCLKVVLRPVVECLDTYSNHGIEGLAVIYSSC